MFEELEAQLRDPNWRVRHKAISALGKIGDEHAIELLIEHLGEFDRTDENSWVNRTASEYLAEMGNQVLERLILALQKMPNHPNDDWRRYWIVHTLGVIGGDRAFETLISTLEDAGIRGGAIDALERIGDKRALEPLIHVLPKCEHYALIAAKRAIAKFQRQ